MPPEAPVAALGLIAGKGAYPLELAESARAQGVKRLFAVAFKHETDKAINRLCDEVRWMYVGQLAAFVEAFRGSGVRAAVMAGQITPSHLFSLRLDAPMRALLAALPRRNADTIFGAIGDERVLDRLRAAVAAVQQQRSQRQHHGFAQIAGSHPSLPRRCSTRRATSAPSRFARSAR